MSFLRRAKLLKFFRPPQGFAQGLQGLDQVTEKNRIPIPGPEISDEVSVDEKSRDVPRDGVGESGERIDLQRGSDADQEVGVAFVRFLQRHRLVSPDFLTICRKLLAKSHATDDEGTETSETCFGTFKYLEKNLLLLILLFRICAYNYFMHSLI